MRRGMTVVRRASVDDAHVIARVLCDFNAEFDMASPPAEELAANIAERLEADEIIVLIAGSGPEGLSLLQFHVTVWSRSLDAYLAELYVVPDRRGEGIGRTLLDATLEAARERGAGRIELNTSTDDTAAIALYETSGFTNREGGPDGPSMLYYERDL
jgi:ribosomal protein S18 acetylase RimI-like enzyme